jgi:hypothetical protein
VSANRCHPALDRTPRTSDRGAVETVPVVSSGGSLTIGDVPLADSGVPVVSAGRSMLDRAVPAATRGESLAIGPITRGM